MRMASRPTRRRTGELTGRLPNGVNASLSGFQRRRDVPFPAGIHAGREGHSQERHARHPDGAIGRGAYACATLCRHGWVARRDATPTSAGQGRPRKGYSPRRVPQPRDVLDPGGARTPHGLGFALSPNGATDARRPGRKRHASTVETPRDTHRTCRVDGAVAPGHHARGQKSATSVSPIGPGRATRPRGDEAEGWIAETRHSSRGVWGCPR